MGVFKNKLNVLVLIIFVAALLLTIYTLIFGDKTNVGESINGINAEQVAIYVAKDYLVSDYNTFYEVESIVNQIITSMSKEEYNKIYTSLSKEMIEDISKEKCIELMKEFYISNFSNVTNSDGQAIVYKNKQNLSYLHEMKENVYIARVKNNKDGMVNFGIELLDNNKWQIVYLEF